MQKRKRLILPCLAAICLAPMAQAEPLAEIICAPTEEMTRKLSGVQGTQLHAWGMQEPEQVMQLWTGDNGSWSLVIRYATGVSCLVAMGDNWETLQTEKPV